MDFTFFVWLLVAIIQITLFSFYLGKMSKSDKQEIFHETIDIVPICNYNGKTYYLENGSLYRENVGMVTMDKRNAEEIDQLNSKDLNPSEIIYILDLLEDTK